MRHLYRHVLYRAPVHHLPTSLPKRARLAPNTGYRLCNSFLQDQGPLPHTLRVLLSPRDSSAFAPLLLVPCPLSLVICSRGCIYLVRAVVRVLPHAPRPRGGIPRLHPLRAGQNPKRAQDTRLCARRTDSARSSSLKSRVHSDTP